MTHKCTECGAGHSPFLQSLGAFVATIFVSCCVGGATGITIWLVTSILFKL